MLLAALAGGRGSATLFLSILPGEPTNIQQPELCPSTLPPLGGTVHVFRSPRTVHAADPSRMIKRGVDSYLSDFEEAILVLPSLSSHLSSHLLSLSSPP